MVSLKRLLAATAVATAGLVGVAQAQTPPQLTNDEKATVKLVHDFNACVSKKAPAFRAAAEANQKAAEAKATEVVKASEAAVRDAASKAGLTKAQADEILEGMTDTAAQMIYSDMNKARVRPDVACIAEMKIDVKDAQARVNALVQKYGQEVFDRKP